MRINFIFVVENGQKMKCCKKADTKLVKFEKKLIEISAIVVIIFSFIFIYS